MPFYLASERQRRPSEHELGTVCRTTRQCYFSYAFLVIVIVIVILIFLVLVIAIVN